MENTKKLDLNEEGEKIFRAALRKAYDGGSQNSTWIFNNMMELIVSPSEIIEKIVEEYTTSKSSPSLNQKQKNPVFF